MLYNYGGNKKTTTKQYSLKACKWHSKLRLDFINSDINFYIKIRKLKRIVKMTIVCRTRGKLENSDAIVKQYE